LSKFSIWNTDSNIAVKRELNAEFCGYKLNLGSCKESKKGLVFVVHYFFFFLKKKSWNCKKKKKNLVYIFNSNILGSCTLKTIFLHVSFIDRVANLDCMILLMITVWLPQYDFSSVFFLMHIKETLDFTPSPMLFFFLVHLVVVDTISNSVSITDSAFRMISWDTIPFDLILVILSLTLCLSLSQGF